MTTTTTTPALPSSMTERAWQGAVVQLAQMRGWLVHHHYDSRRSQPGWPDLVLVKGDRALFVELKTEHGRLSRDQRTWLIALASAGLDVAVWRPRDLPVVMAVLAGQPLPAYPTGDPS